MGRKTFSFSALALAAIATFSFLSADGAEAYAQSAEDQAVAPQVEETAEQLVEIVPEPVVFTSQEVAQPLPEKKESETDAEYEVSSLRELVGMVGDVDTMGEQMRCLAQAIYFESRGEELAGQLAVAQVIVNRSEDRRWPASYCGVVKQPSQFSFVRNGRIPSVRSSSAAWERAKAVAKIAHDEMWESKVKDAVYFHATHAKPRWSRVKTRVAQIDTHIFYR